MGSLRLLLAFGVVISHTQAMFGFVGMGGSAVPAFFIISGFYMSLVLGTKYNLSDTWLFYSNRALRLFPCYWLSVFIVLMISLVPWTGNVSLDRFLALPKSTLAYAASGDQASAFAAVPNLTMFGADLLRIFQLDLTSGNLVLWWHGVPEGATLRGTYNYLFLPQIWSLSAELMFYAAAPMLVRRSNICLIVIIIACAVCTRWLSMTLAWGNLLPTASASFFLIGILAFRASERLNRLRSTLKVALGLAPFALWALWPMHSVGQWFCWVLFAASVPVLFDLTKSLRWDRSAGNLSYPVYLCHTLFAYPATALGDLAAPAAFVASCGLSWAMLKLVDDPIERWRQDRVKQARIPRDLESDLCLAASPQNRPA